MSFCNDFAKSLEGCTFEYLKLLKKKARGSPPCPRKRDRKWDCGITFGCFTHAKAWVNFSKIYLTNTL